MHSPFIHKYQPLYLKDFEMDSELVSLIQTLIDMDALNVLFVGDSGCGKSSITQAIVREYYGDTPPDDNILYINTLKDQVSPTIEQRLRHFVKPQALFLGKKC